MTFDDLVENKMEDVEALRQPAVCWLRAKWQDKAYRFLVHPGTAQVTRDGCDGWCCTCSGEGIGVAFVYIGRRPHQVRMYGLTELDPAQDFRALPEEVTAHELHVLQNPSSELLSDENRFHDI